MSEARDLVAHLQAEAVQQEKLLAQKQMEAKAALQKITDTIQSAGVKRGEMQDLRSTIATENVALTERWNTVAIFSLVIAGVKLQLKKKKGPKFRDQLDSCQRLNVDEWQMTSERNVKSEGGRRCGKKRDCAHGSKKERPLNHHRIGVPSMGNDSNGKKRTCISADEWSLSLRLRFSSSEVHFFVVVTDGFR